MTLKNKYIYFITKKESTHKVYKYIYTLGYVPVHIHVYV